jgi:hypothetical protein
VSDRDPPRPARGVGASSGRACLVERCGRPVAVSGLCSACYRAWRRGGEAGLRRRAARVALGRRCVWKPRTVEEARSLLEQSAIALADAQSDDDANWQELRDVLWLAALACARVTGDVRAVYHERWKAKTVAAIGEDAWRARHREAQRRYREKSTTRSSPVNVRRTQDAMVEEIVAAAAARVAAAGDRPRERGGAESSQEAQRP